MEPTLPTIEGSSDLQTLAANMKKTLTFLVEEAFAKLQTSRAVMIFVADDARVTQVLENSPREEIAQLVSRLPENMSGPVDQRIVDTEPKPSSHTQSSSPSIGRFEVKD